MTNRRKIGGRMVMNMREFEGDDNKRRKGENKTR